MAENENKEEEKKSNVTEDDKYITINSTSYNFNASTKTSTPITGLTQPNNVSVQPITNNTNLLYTNTTALPVTSSSSSPSKQQQVINDYTNKKSSNINETQGNYEIKVKKNDQNVQSLSTPAKSEAIITVTNLDELSQKEIVELQGEEKEQAIDKMRTYNVKTKDKDGNPIEAVGRKNEGGKDGLIYQIDTVLNHPENIKFEGYILYEKPIDIASYRKMVNTVTDEVDPSVKDVKVKTQAYVESATTDNDNSRFNEEEKQGRNKLNQAIDNVVTSGSLVAQIYDSVDEDVKIFEKFNENLKYLKQGTKLTILVNAMKRINNQRIALSQTYHTETTSDYSTSRPSNRISEVKVNEYVITMIDSGRSVSNTHQIGVTTTTYLNISTDGIMNEVVWDKREEFKDDIATLERRLKEANRAEEITYNYRDIVDMDDKNSRWYRE